MAISSNREVEFENILRSFVSEGDNQFRALQRRAGAQRARCIAAAQNLTIRQAVNRELDGRWGNTIASDTDLLIVGAGIHGTIAALAAQCIVQVIEKSRMGGGFWTNGPSYYLNSRNRPPREGENIPGGRGALNYIPGGLDVRALSVSYRRKVRRAHQCRMPHVCMHPSRP